MTTRELEETVEDDGGTGNDETFDYSDVEDDDTNAGAGADAGDDGDDDVEDETADDEPDLSARRAGALERLKGLLPEVDEDGDVISHLEGINERTISQMSPAARVVIRQLLAANASTTGEVAKAKAGVNKDADAVRAELAKERAAIAEERKRLSEKQARFAALANNPKVQEMLAKSDAVDESNIDILTPEGQRAYQTKLFGQTFKELLEPFNEAAKEEAAAAERQRKLDDYIRLREEIPQMKDKAFRDRVAAYRKAAEQRGESVSPRTAAQHLLDRDRLSEIARERDAREAARRRERRGAQATVGKSGAVSGAEAESDIVKRVKRIRKEGYAGLRGGPAQIAYFDKNPNAKKAWMRAKGLL